MKVPGNTNPTVVSTAALSQNCAIDVSLFATNATAGTAIGKINGKYPPLSYPSLEGAVIANYAVDNGDSTSLEHTVCLLRIIQLSRVLVGTLKDRKEEGITRSSSFLPCLVDVLRSIYPCQPSMV